MVVYRKCNRGRGQTMHLLVLVVLLATMVLGREDRKKGVAYKGDSAVAETPPRFIGRQTVPVLLQQNEVFSGAIRKSKNSLIDKLKKKGKALIRKGVEIVKCKVGKKINGATKKVGLKTTVFSSSCPKKVKPKPPAKVPEQPPRPVAETSDEGCVICLYTMQKLERVVATTIPGDPVAEGRGQGYSSNDRVIVAGPDATPMAGPEFSVEAVSFLEKSAILNKHYRFQRSMKGGKEKKAASKQKKADSAAKKADSAAKKKADEKAGSAKKKADEKAGSAKKKADEKAGKPKPLPPKAPTIVAKPTTPKCPPGMPFCRKPIFHVGPRATERHIKRLQKLMDEKEMLDKIEDAYGDILEDTPPNYENAVKQLFMHRIQIANQMYHDYSSEDVCVDVHMCDDLLLKTGESAVFRL